MVTPNAWLLCTTAAKSISRVLQPDWCGPKAGNTKMNPCNWRARPTQPDFAPTAFIVFVAHFVAAHAFKLHLAGFADLDTGAGDVAAQRDMMRRYVGKRWRGERNSESIQLRGLTAMKTHPPYSAA